ncbi:SIS domain-containing protein [Actinocorallia longicatena]|uniref:SIS domain-containing protein n=1 Tax=Actinocorallia longicatena TaxID=111803 RepID=A0ABP6QN10_9ACTN
MEDVDALEAADPAGMLRRLAGGAAQIRQAQRLAAEAGIDVALEHAQRPRSIVIAGDGLVGDIVAAVCGIGCPIPVISPPEGPLPGWIGATDLLFAVGEDSLALADQALRRGMSVVTVGLPDGRLSQFAIQSRSLHLPVPNTGPARTELWARLVPVLLVVRGLGLLQLSDETLESTAALLEDLAHRLRPSSEPFVNPAKQIALELKDALPMAWGTGPLTWAAARRFTEQLADNAKRASAVPRLGALDATPPAQDADDFFRDRGDDPETALHVVIFEDTGERRPAVGEVARARSLAVTEFKAEGTHPLERVASLITVCDYVSVYLALSLGIDPTPVAAVSEFKARTA